MNNLKHFVFFIVIFFVFNETIAQKSEDHSTLNQTKTDSTMQLVNIHDSTQLVSAQILFKGTEGTTRTLQIKKEGVLKEHITKVEALLICVSGEVIYEDEKNKKMVLKSSDYIRIEPMVKHWITGVQDSQLLLIK